VIRGVEFCGSWNKICKSALFFEVRGGPIYNDLCSEEHKPVLTFVCVAGFEKMSSTWRKIALKNWQQGQGRCSLLFLRR
jgi:hypothetical protein